MLYEQIQEIKYPFQYNYKFDLILKSVLIILKNLIHIHFKFDWFA